MSSTRQNGMVTITNDENYDLAGHMARLADSANVIIPVTNQAARDALTPATGMTVYRIDTGALEVYSAGAFTPVTQILGASPWMVHCGVASVSVPSGNAVGTATVTFPSAFTQSPIVVATPNALTGNNSYKLMAHVYSQSTTSCTIDLRMIDGSAAAATYTIPVFWIAIQMTPTSAAG